MLELLIEKLPRAGYLPLILMAFLVSFVIAGAGMHVLGKVAKLARHAFR